MRMEQFGYRVDKCKLCGKPVVWALNTAGGSIPLDPVAPCFVVTSPWSPVCTKTKLVDMDVRAPSDAKKLGPAVTLASHFSTCVAKTRAWKLLEEIRREALRRESGELPIELARRIDAYLAPQ